MPPKRGKKQQQPPASADSTAAPVASAEDSGPNHEAVLLQQEYEHACQALEGLKGRRAQLRAQHEFLQQEAQVLRAESLEFMGFLAKRVQRRQDATVSLSEENWRTLREIEWQQQEVLARFQEQRAALQGQLLDKEAELSHLDSELKELKGVRALQQEQAARIRELQQELVAARKQQVQRLQEAKAHFLQEKATYEQEAQQQARLLAQQAHRVAMQCLQEHSQAVHQQNQELRQELQHLVRRAQELQAHKQLLQDQVQRLQQEHHYLEDLSLLRRGGKARKGISRQHGATPVTEGHA